jgi:hypothetical protein
LPTVRVVLTLVLGAVASVAASALPDVAASAAPSEMNLTGTASGLLYPGAKGSSVPVTLQNPSGETVYFTRVLVTVESTGDSRCRPDWFQTSGVEVSAKRVAVPPGSSIRLPAGGVRAPTIRMLESGTNQDACQNARLTLSYTTRAQAGGGTQPAPNPGNTPTPGGTSGGGRQLPFTGFDPRLLLALGLLLLTADVGLRRAARERER